MIRFLIPEPKGRRSGGTLYNLQMVETLLEKGCDIKTDWVSENIGIKNLITDLDKEDLLIIDGLVFHQNYRYATLLEGFDKIYITHLPFWLEPGINEKENELRKLREIDFIKKCNIVICTSNFIQVQIAECGISKEKILVINPGLIGQSSRKQTYKKNPTELLVVGSMHYGKGIDILIKALEQLKNYVWKLKVAGDFDPNDAYFESIEKAIDKLGLSARIQFLGECSAEKIKELYLNSDLLIHPSRFESYGMVVGEALCNGLPVLASDAGALPSVYNLTPVRFYKSEDVQALSKMLHSICSAEVYLQLVKESENYIFKARGKDEYYDKINKLISYLQ